MERSGRKFYTTTYKLSPAEVRSALCEAIMDGEHHGCPNHDAKIEHHEDGSISVTSTYEEKEK